MLFIIRLSMCYFLLRDMSGRDLKVKTWWTCRQQVVFVWFWNHEATVSPWICRYVPIFLIWPILVVTVISVFQKNSQLQGVISRTWSGSMVISFVNLGCVFLNAPQPGQSCACMQKVPKPRPLFLLPFTNIGTTANTKPVRKHPTRCTSLLRQRSTIFASWAPDFSILYHSNNLVFPTFIISLGEHLLIICSKQKSQNP